MDKQSNDIYNPLSRFDESNVIHETAIIYDNVVMGKNNTIGAYAVIGSDGEIRGVKKFEGQVIIGSNNRISELVTIQRPADTKAITSVGDNNIIMAHSHLGHDCKVGSNCEIATGTIIGGYATIKDGVKLKLGVTIRNRKIIGKNALVGMGSVVVKDVKENTTIVGNPGKPLIK